MRQRDPSVEPLRAGHHAVIAALIAIVLIAAWFSLGYGRSGSLSDCFPAVPWLRDLIGKAVWVSITAMLGLVVFSLFGESRWWGLSSVGLVLVSLPVILVVVFALMYGDPGPDSAVCPRI